MALKKMAKKWLSLGGKPECQLVKKEKKREKRKEGFETINTAKVVDYSNDYLLPKSKLGAVKVNIDQIVRNLLILYC